MAGHHRSEGAASRLMTRLVPMAGVINVFDHGIGKSR
jgi:hypothetical protein